uniref:Uncharacterized protein n=1 Tax=Arundo donax TaxID=35708 RepID=A0A0A8ZPC6_ARUDO
MMSRLTRPAGRTEVRARTGTSVLQLPFSFSQQLLL